MTTPPQKHSRCSGRSALIVAGCVAVLASCLYLANQVRAEDDLAITPAFDTQTPITTNKPIELNLSRPLKTSEGYVAIMINRTDLTSLFVIDGQRRVYSPALVPLPLGQMQLVVYLVSQESSWREIGRFNLQVVKERPATNPTPALPAE